MPDIRTHFERYVKLLFFCAVLVIPLIFYVHVKHHYEFPKTMAARTLMIPATVMFFLAFAGRFWKTKNPFRLPFLLLLSAATLSALKSVNLCETLDPKYLTDIYLYLLVAHFIMAARFTEKEVHFYGVLLAVAGLISALYGTIQFYELEPVLLKGWPLEKLAVKGDRVAPVAFQGNRNYSSEFYNLAFPMTVAVFFISRRWASRIFFLICLFAIRYHLLIAATRATTVGLVATFPVVLLILFWIERRQWPRLVFLLILYKFVEHLLELSVRYRGFHGWPTQVWADSALYYFAAPLLLYALYYFGIPLIATLFDSDTSSPRRSPGQLLSTLFRDILHGRRPEYAKVVQSHLSLTRRMQHLALFTILTLGIISGVIVKTSSLAQEYHNYLIEEQLLRQRKPTYSSFFLEWLGPKTYSYRARHPEYEYQWRRPAPAPSEDWKVPTFSQFVKDKIDEKFFWDRSITFRIEVYNSALRIVRDNIWLGAGIGTFKIVHDLYTSQLERFVLGKEVLARKVHDEYMTYAGMHGAFGLLALFWIQMVFLKLSYRLFRAYRPDRFSLLIARLGARRAHILLCLSLGLFWGVTLTWVSMVFGHSYTLPTSHFLIWASLGLLVTLYYRLFGTREKGRRDPEAASDTPPRGLARLPALERFPNRLLLGLFLGWFLTVPFFFHWMGESLLQHGMQLRNWIDELPKWVRQYRSQLRGLRPQWSGAFTPAEEQYVADRFYQAIQLNSPHLAKERFASIDDAERKLRSQLFDLFDKSIKAWPFHMETYYILGRYCIDFDEPKKGIEVLTQDLFMNPNYKWAMNNIGVCFDQDGQYHRARDVYYRALIIDPQQIFAHFNLAQGYMLGRNPYTGGESLEGTPADRQGLRNVDAKYRNLPMAVKHFEGVLDSNPRRLDVYGKLAYCLLELDQCEQALQVLEDYFYIKQNTSPKADGYVDDDANNYAILTQVYDRLNQPEEVLKTYQHLIRVAPGVPVHRMRYARELIQQNRLQEALTETRTLSYLVPKEERIQLQMAELVLVVKGDRQETLKYLRRAVELGGTPIIKAIQQSVPLQALQDDPEFQALIGK